MAVQFECWAGPADGLILDLEAEYPFLDYVYLRLPIKGVKHVYKEPPAVPYSRYRLGFPSDGKAQWAGDVISEATP